MSVMFLDSFKDFVQWWSINECKGGLMQASAVASPGATAFLNLTGVAAICVDSEYHGSLMLMGY